MINFNLFEGFAIYSGFVYLRVCTAYWTLKHVDKGLANEMNPFMGDLVKIKNRNWFYVNEIIFYFAVLAVIFFTNNAFIFILLFFFWINFQNDWTANLYIKMYEKKKAKQ